MYETVISAINKHENSEFYNNFKERLKAVVGDTNGIGWGFHEELSAMYYQIMWFDLEDVQCDEEYNYDANNR